MPHGLPGIDTLRRLAARTRNHPQPPVEVYGLWDPPPDPAPEPPKVFSTIRAFAAQLKDAETPRVLVVDDDDRVRRFVERVLRDAGCAVVSTDGGAAALERLRAGDTFDLIVSDVRMPDLTGPQFVERARGLHRSVPVLYLTGYNDDLFKEGMALSDDDAFLDKPGTVSGLLEAVSLGLYGHVAPQARGR